MSATASSPVAGNQTLSLAVTGTGITSGDYTLSSNTITINNGQTVGTSTFTVVDDTVLESQESALLTISNPSSGITLGSTVSQSILIADDDELPNPASISPASGTTLGGTDVTITGTGFTDATGVTIDGNPASNLVVVSPTSITATTPPGSAGTASVVVTTPVGSNDANTLFEYQTISDLAVTITDSPDPATADGNVTYTVTLTNNGPNTSASPVVNLPLPPFTTFVSAIGSAGWTPSAPAVGSNGTVVFTADSLASGNSATFTVVAKVALDVVNDSTLTATASSSQSGLDTTPDNNSATANTTARSGADLVATLSAAPDPVVAGTELSYTLRLRNNGPIAAADAALGFSLPAGTTFVSLSGNPGWTPVTPAVGSGGSVSITNPLFADDGDVSFTLVVKVDSGVATGSTINPTLNASSATVDIAPGNESSGATSNVITRSDLTIGLSSTPSSAPKGSNVTFSIVITNNGPSDAVSPSVNFPIPAQMSFVSADAPDGWSSMTPAVDAGGTVIFNKSGLVNGASATLTVITKVNADAPNGTVLAASASASASGTDLVSDNNSSSTAPAVGTTSPTAVQLTTTGRYEPLNGLSEFTVNVTNTTPLPINGFRLRVDFSSYIAAFPTLRLYNASSAPGSPDVFIDYPYPVAVDAIVPVKLTFYTNTRTLPIPFEPVLTIESLAVSAVADSDGRGVEPRVKMLAGGNAMLEFDSVPDRWYRIRYSHNLSDWFDSPVPIQASNNRMQWIDSGAPFTVSPPSSVPSRFYRVNEITPAR